MSFWDVVWFILITYVFIAVLMMLFSIFSDLFRDKELSGWVKAMWIIALVFLPIITALVYLVVRGSGMAQRSAQRAEAMRLAQDSYIRDVAGKASPADEIAQARDMLDAGVITEAEYTRLKEKSLV